MDDAMPDRPNILLITSDQQHYDTLGVTNPRIKTPALDRLCREGTRFNRAYCNNPVCSPSRSTMITGMYPSQHGCWTIGVKLPEDVPTVGDAFQRLGYDSTLIGKAHFQPLNSQPGSESLESHPKMFDLDFWRNFHGPFYGFNHIELHRNHADEYHVGQHYAIWMEERGLKNWRDYFLSWPPKPKPAAGSTPYWEESRQFAWDLPEEFHYTRWTAERTIARIEKNAQEKKPFFLWASFADPHPPYLVPEPWASMYNPADMEPGTLEPGEIERWPSHFARTQQPNPDFSDFAETQWANHGLHTHLHDREILKRQMAVYYGMISFMDQQIGRILDSLDRDGLAENTLIVFSTDHGHFLGQHGLIAKGPFHFEDLIRVPFIVRYPGRVPANRSDDSLQSLVDLAPTFLTAAGATPPGIMQGINQLDVWEGKSPSARDCVVVENRHQPTRVHLRTYVNGRYKLTVYRDRNEGELFDLHNDPHERRNLWSNGESASLKAEMMAIALNAELVREPTRMQRISGA